MQPLRAKIYILFVKPAQKPQSNLMIIHNLRMIQRPSCSLMEAGTSDHLYKGVNRYAYLLSRT